MPNNSASIPIQKPLTKISPAKIPVIEELLAEAFFADLAPVKRAYGQLEKYMKQVSIVAQSDTCFLIDKLDLFINKNANVQLTQYTLFR